MSKPQIPIQPIDFDIAKRAVEEFSTERNVPKQIFPQVASVDREGEGSAVRHVPLRAPMRKFTVELPNYVIDAVHARTVQARPHVTARYVVLEGLKAIGIEVKDEDMVHDGRRTRASGDL